MHLYPLSLGTIKRMIELQASVPVEQQSLMGWAHNSQLTDEVRT